MANGTYPFPLAGGVDLDGKPFQLADDSMRKLQNVIPDKFGNPVRRPSMQSLYPLATNATIGRVSNATIHDPAVTDPQEAVFVPPLWLSVPPFEDGLFLYATSKDSARLDLVVSAGEPRGKDAIAVNLLYDSAPTLLPGTFAKLGAQYIVYGANTHGSPGIKISRDENDGIVIEDFQFEGADNTELRPKLVCEHQDRFVYGNLGDSEDEASSIIFSDIDEPLVVGASASTDRNIIVGFRDGQKLRALHSVMAAAAGTPAQSMLLALKTKSAYLLVGEPNETNDVDDPRGALVVNKISGSAGCVSQASIVDTPWGTIWCGPDDVWFMPFNSVPLPIGRKLRPMLLAQPEATQFRIHAVFNDGFYKLALFSDGQGPDLTLPLGEQWWLDLRNGPPNTWTEAKWLGPQLFKPTSYIGAGRDVDSTATAQNNALCIQNGTCFMAVDNREGAGGRLYGVQFAEYPSMYGDGGYTNVLVAYDGNSARDWSTLIAPPMRPWEADTEYQIGDEIVVWELGSGVGAVAPQIWVIGEVRGTQLSGSTEPAWEGFTSYIDNEVTWYLVSFAASPACMYGSEILTAIQTKESDLGTRMVEKLFRGAELAVFLTVPQRLKLTQLIDAGEQTETINTDLQVGATSPTLGSSLFELDMPAFNEKVQTAAFWSDESTRTVGRSAQLEFAEVNGIVLPEDPTFYVIIGALPYPVTLASSYYATVTALATAMVAAMTAQIPSAAHEDGFILTDGGALFKIEGNGGGSWAAGITDATSRFIWTLIGFTNFDGVEADTITGNEIPYDVAIGNISYVEAIVHFRPFNRRPL